MMKPNLNLKGLLNTAQVSMGKYSPQIMTGIGVVGMLTTVVLAVKATPKALELIEEEKAKTEQEKLTPVQKVKTAWKPYLPAAIIGGTSTLCLIGACTENTRRIAALTAAYKLSETALSEYKDAVVETIGEKKEEKVRQTVAQKKLDERPVSKEIVITTQKGNVLCYDPLNDRYFRSDMNAIRKAENELNAYLRSEDYISVNEFYDFLNLKHSELGDRMGWHIDKSGYVDIDIHAMVAENDEPCLVLDFSYMPTYEYAKY